MHAFNPAVRGFRRNQGISLLSCLYKNTRLLLTFKENNDKDFAELEDKILESTIEVSRGRIFLILIIFLILLKILFFQIVRNKCDQILKPSFTAELFSLLYTVKVSKYSIGSSRWEELIKLLQPFLTNGCTLTAVPRKYVAKLCSLFNTNSTSRLVRLCKVVGNVKKILKFFCNFF